MLRAGWFIRSEEYVVSLILLRPMRATCIIAAAIVISIGLAGLAGCASRSSASGAWADGQRRGSAYQRVLIVGVSPNINQRCPFERFLATRVKAKGTAAIVSCDVIDHKTPLSPDVVKAAVAEQKADAVIATNLVSKQWEVQEGGQMDTRGGGMYKATDAGYVTGWYGAYGMPVIYGEFATQPSVDTLETDARVQTRVFDARSATLVYTMDTRARGVSSPGAGLAAVTTTIADKLRKSGVIR
jgi:hypothetical protein